MRLRFEQEACAESVPLVGHDAFVELVRVAMRSDLPGVVALWRANGGPTRSPGGMIEAIALFERDPEALIVAEADSQIIGSVIAGWDGWRFHIYRLAVTRELRRRGVAQRLIEAAHQRAKAVGAQRIDAMVDPDNLGALAFWESAGYTLDYDRRWSYIVTAESSRPAEG